MTSQPSLLQFFNKKTSVPEPNHTNHSDDIPCSSNIINNTEIESNTDTTNLTEFSKISQQKIQNDYIK